MTQKLATFSPHDKIQRSKLHLPRKGDEVNTPWTCLTRKTKTATESGVLLLRSPRSPSESATRVSLKSVPPKCGQRHAGLFVAWKSILNSLRNVPMHHQINVRLHPIQTRRRHTAASKYQTPHQNDTRNTANQIVKISETKGRGVKRRSKEH